MLFNSLLFLFGFLPVVLFVYWLLRSRQQRYIWLTVAGYVFYGTWNYKFCGLMLFSTLVSYTAGLGMLRWDAGRLRKLCLVLPITVDLLLLGFFKYFNFGLLTFATISAWFKHQILIHPIDIILPVGISFYTFHTITYIVDSYRGTIKPTRNFFEFACYVCLFPQLVAGPIVRFRQIESDLENLDHADRLHDVNRAWSFFAIGMMKKVLIADSIANIINPALANYAQLSTLDTWLCVLGYTYQLYFDFSGYSDMAVGLGYMLGLRLPQNFNSPYKSVDISDFWRRWHISLSTCLRDYLYIPMGGNRKGEARTYTNLLITMLLGGLWHGANWTFVVWGGYHGALLSLNRLFKTEIERWNIVFRRTITFLAVVIGWVFFRATDFHMAGVLLRKMFTYEPGFKIVAQGGLVFLLTLSFFVAHFALNTFEIKHNWRPATSVLFAAAYVLCLAIIAGGVATPFLYFQF
jgi:alginate O-acetyltransferase complex protein AlgI